MARFNPDTYPHHQSFDAHAHALRREELAHLAALARERIVLVLRRARRLVASDNNSNVAAT